MMEQAAPQVPDEYESDTENLRTGDTLASAHPPQVSPVKPPQPPIARNLSDLLDSTIDGSHLDDRTGGVSKGRFIADVVHGLVFMSEKCLLVVDTPEFQRLRNIRQLGVTHLVFPSAVHTRFEHSLGVSHLAGIMAESLAGKLLRNEEECEGLFAQEGDRQKFTEHLELVRVAGLCHDLGHGPFGHSFENWVRKNIDPHWSHEDMSCTLFRYIVKKYSLNFNEEEIQFVEHAIRGIAPQGTKFPWLFSIVANSENGVDVDKFDYIARDAYHTGVSSFNCRFERLIQTARVVDRKICWPDKEAYSIYELFHARYSLHKMVYSHRVRKSIECMLDDILVSLNERKQELAAIVHDPANFVKLDDYSILRDLPQQGRDILNAIQCRTLYKTIVEYLEPPDAENLGDGVYGELSEQAAAILPVVVSTVALDYAKHDSDPVANVLFFDSRTGRITGQKSRRSISLLLPERFQERIVRLYVRKLSTDYSDMEKRRAVKKIFVDWYLETHHKEASDSVRYFC
eukprot:TRINITY_DN5510_c0_g1_i1.p1 TRINITY_DN5510_c0_g1~~TRINITY_DN5510_c0_g1_i1.p1  ORF type:complete len:514 (-),score=111.28 TRINITY_DN5510_c0_g1_i1:26-1567(-)